MVILVSSCQTVPTSATIHIPDFFLQPPIRPVLNEAPTNNLSAAVRVMTQNLLDLISYIDKRDIYDIARDTYKDTVIKILTR